MEGDEVVIERLDADLWLVRLTGEHDISTAPRVRAGLDDVLAHGTHLLVDLTETEFIDSSVIATLIDVHRRVETQPDEVLVIVAPAGSQPARVFEIAGLHALLPIHDTREAALQALPTETNPSPT